MSVRQCITSASRCILLPAPVAEDRKTPSLCQFGHHKSRCTVHCGDAGANGTLICWGRTSALDVRSVNTLRGALGVGGYS